MTSCAFLSVVQIKLTMNQKSKYVLCQVQKYSENLNRKNFVGSQFILALETKDAQEKI